MISSLYLHIPFCLSKCSYCSFTSFPGMEKNYNAYLNTLKREIASLSKEFGTKTSLSTIFLGGGTPTILSGEQLSDLLSRCFSMFAVDADCEISIEANPGTVNLEKLQKLREEGFNRLSIGVQSFDAHELQALGRTHTPVEAVKAIEAAKSAGFDNISIDLMYGIPGQNGQSWKQNLDTALALCPQHLSLYQLTLEENTPMKMKYDSGVLSMPDEKQILMMDEYNQTATSQCGLFMYEISNYSRKGAECRHNCNYWFNNEYLAAGAGAVSYTRGVRERRIGDPSRYIRDFADKGTAVIEVEQLDNQESFRETVIMGLRMSSGVSAERLRQRYGIELLDYYGPVLERLVKESLVELTDGCLRVTKKGRLFSNVVMAELV